MEKKIAFYISSLKSGGAERVISNLANDFSDAGYEVTMINDYRETTEYYSLKPEVRRSFLPKEEQGHRIRNAVRRVTNLRGAVKESGAEALVSFIGKSNLRAILATRFLRTAVIVSVRSAPAREYGTRVQRMLARLLFHFAEGVVFQTTQARDYFAKGIRKKSIVLMNPLHQDFIRERYEGVRKQEIVTVGRLHRVKNHELLIQAFSALMADYPELVLRIYGDGDYQEQLEAVISRQHLENRVLLAGDCRDVADAIQKARIFVLSSDVEGMPNALLEAMALGLAVVSTDCPCGGPAMVIREGENGLLVPVGDARAMEQAIRRILDDPGLEEHLGRNAHRIGNELRPERVNRQWMEYIDQAVGRS